LKSSGEYKCLLVADEEDGVECETMAGLADLFSAKSKRPFAFVMRKENHLRIVSQWYIRNMCFEYQIMIYAYMPK
jgi:hypothetical protein